MTTTAAEPITLPIEGMSPTPVPDDRPPKARKARKARKTRKTPSTSTTRRTPPTGPSYAQIEEALNAFVGFFGTAFAARGDEYCSTAVFTDGPQISKALTDLARQNPSVKRALSALVVTSGWGAVITASTMLAVKVGAHHGIIPPQAARAIGAPLPDLEPSGPDAVAPVPSAWMDVEAG